MTHSSKIEPQPIDADETHSERPVLTLVAADGTPRIAELLTQPAQSNHIVQFYEDESFLYDNVTQFLGAGLSAGEPTILIATESRRRAFVQRLRLNGFDIEALARSGSLLVLDAKETLSRFMVDGMPDWYRFVGVIGSTIEKSLTGNPGGRVRAYGEMVDLLWREGNKQAAIRLEELWNELGKSHSFSLLCAYVMGNFYKSSDTEQFRDICRSHTHVIPSEGYSRLESPEARHKEVSRLQQRARSLEHEVEQRRELELAMRQALVREQDARVNAEQTVRYNEMFAGMLGHDLRNPLNAITTAAYYIARANPGVKTGTAANRIVSSAERMARMIDQLLDFTQIRIGNGLALRHTRLDLMELCYRIRDELEAAHPECVISVESDGNTVGEWDHDRMLQVISNLVGNAIHHGSEGCQVSIQGNGTESDDVTISVHNRGAVSPELLPVLFEPFRGSARYEKTRGLGLGLYITRQIVTAHGGSIDVESSPSSGTTFRVRLPRAPVG